MQSSTPAIRDIVLVGGGHSHVQVLKSFAMHPLAGVRLTLISNSLQSPYSGMLPGCVAGFYQPDEIHINVERLCQFGGTRFIEADVIGLDCQAHAVHLRDRPPIRFDTVSINCGAEPVAPHPGALTVKPIARFLPAWHALRSDLRDNHSVALVGGGAGGVELAFAIRAVFPGVAISVVGDELLPGHNDRVRALALAQFARRNIEWTESLVRDFSHDRLTLESGREIRADHILWITNVRAAPWLRASGLATDEDGFVSVDGNLRSISHADVFAAGDVAHLVGQERPKSGVYAVRQGPILAHNLRQVVLHRPLRNYRAQRVHLSLLGCGDRSAIASRGRWASHGTIWWRLKQFIDLRFMRRFNDLAFMPDEGFSLPAAFAGELPEEAMRCGGCGAKLAADPLRRVLARLPVQTSDNVVLGIGDDAALVKNIGTGTLLTVDGFRAMISDPYRFGRIAAHHSLNDVFAMGAKPIAALALVTIPLMAEALMEEDLFQLLSGVTDVLAEHDVALAGGHSAEGAELSLGLTVSGAVPGDVLTKAGACAGDRLILTKPLGTGVILAAAMRGLACAASLRAATVAMDQSNAPAAALFRSHRAHALTDVTGFGLAGHLGEMLRASRVGVALDVASVPALPGATALLADVASSLQRANELALNDYELKGLSPADSRLRLLADPQTSGGLLAAVPEDRADACLNTLTQAGYDAAIIGEITASGRWQIA